MAWSEGMFPKLMPKTVEFFGVDFYQTVITSSLSVLLFVLFVVLYKYIKRKNPKNGFVLMVEMVVEWFLDFFNSLYGNIPVAARVYILFLFFFILWNNVIWVIGDMFSYVWPFLHEIFRPVTSDLIFNAVLATIGVVWAIVYWFKVNWFKFIEKYIPYKGLGLAEDVKWWYAPIIRFFDVVLALFIGLLEFVGEFIKIVSLTLRLFWNILAGIILLWLMIVTSMFFSKILIGKEIPLLLPLIVFVFELFVAFLQALVFSLLVLVYFKLAEASHH